MDHGGEEFSVQGRVSESVFQSSSTDIRAAVDVSIAQFVLSGDEEIKRGLEFAFEVKLEDQNGDKGRDCDEPLVCLELILQSDS